MVEQNRLWGGIEAGGTKINCAIANDAHQFLAEERIVTTTPTETLAQIIAFFQVQQQRIGDMNAIGLGSFGPVDLNPASKTYGFLLNTPKPGWQQIDVVGTLMRSLHCPIRLDTDVNAAALGEHRSGAAQGLDTFLYLTVGTGIGGGAMVNGKLLHGLLHPEMGHIPMPQDKRLDPFAGCCPFHGNCLEGLASGTAIAARWGKTAEQLMPEHPAWELEAEYLATAIVTWTLTLAPQRIILGGGVMHQQHLFARIREQVRAKLDNYWAVPDVLENMDDYIVAPQLGDRAGMMGAIALAQQSE